MRKFLTLVLAIIFTFSFASSSCAGESEYLKAKKYYSEKKLPYLAYSLGFILPSAGHIYAEDWPRGLDFLWKELLCLGLVMTGDTTSKAAPNQDDSQYQFGVAMTVSGVIGYLFFHFWDAADAWQTAEDFNNKLKEKYGLNMSRKNNDLAIYYTLNF